MRLLEDEKSSIITSVERYLPEKNASLFLFGSRTDENRRGGDIDLLLVVNDKVKSKLKQSRARILVDIKKGIGERRIDLTILSNSELIDKMELTPP